MTQTSTQKKSDYLGPSYRAKEQSHIRTLMALVWAGIRWLFQNRIAKYLVVFGLAWIALNILNSTWEELPLDVDKINSTIIRIIVALVVSAVLFVGFNLYFNLPLKSWLSFSTILGAVLGLLYFVILDGNNLLIEIGPRFVFWPVLGLLAGGVLLNLLSLTEDSQIRTLLGVSILGALGIAEGLGWKSEVLPQIDWAVALLTTLVVAAAFALLGWLIRQSTAAISRWGLVGIAAGWTLGAWGGAELGAGTQSEAIVASVVPMIVLGIRFGMTHNPDRLQRAKVDFGSRKYIFLAPAFGFIALGLLLPLLRTIYLSFLDYGRDPKTGTTIEWGWLENYGSIFTSEDNLDLTGGWEFFTSNLTWWGLGFVGVAAVFMVVRKFTSQDKQLRLSTGSISPLVIGWFLLVIAVFATLRGTIINNLWWVFFVTIITTSLGLIIAMLADRARMESIAKSLIFLPMAISFVGASLIWRFIYVARDPGKNQTGIFNSIWVGLGELSVSDSWTIWLATFLLLGICVALLLFAGMSLRAGSNKAALGALLGSLLVGFLLYRIIGPGLGGLRDYDSLSIEPLGFLDWLPGSGWTGLAALIVLVLVTMWLLVMVGANLGGTKSRISLWATLGAVGTGVLSFLLVQPNITNSEASGTADTIIFLEDSPFNNIWLMLILIWIQTGFAMVIFSAAIKSVPTEFIEAAEVDGATETQIFWRIIIPQIATTIGVVVTTLLVLVVKVYDIVQVMTNGNHGTEVLANEMWRQSFTALDLGLGSALAVVLFISVLPVMYYNIRRMQKFGV